MIAGACILLVGSVIGFLLSSFYHKKQTPQKAYDKYKNKDKLYSCRAVKEAGE